MACRAITASSKSIRVKTVIKMTSITAAGPPGPAVAPSGGRDEGEVLEAGERLLEGAEGSSTAEEGSSGSLTGVLAP